MIFLGRGWVVGACRGVRGGEGEGESEDKGGGEGDREGEANPPQTSSLHPLVNT